jgi:hypothetical protein
MFILNILIKAFLYFNITEIVSIKGHSGRQADDNLKPAIFLHALICIIGVTSGFQNHYSGLVVRYYLWFLDESSTAINHQYFCTRHIGFSSP